MRFLNYLGPRAPQGQAKSTASLLAIVAAVVSFVLSFKDNKFTAIAVAGVGIVCGLAGMAQALSPRVSGGILSILAIGLSVLAILVALVMIVLPGM